MDTRRLQELRDVYSRLSHQSTGGDTQAAGSLGTQCGMSTGVSSANTSLSASASPNETAQPQTQPQQQEQQQEQQQQQAREPSGEAGVGPELSRTISAASTSSNDPSATTQPSGSPRTRSSIAARWGGSNNSGAPVVEIHGVDSSSHPPAPHLGVTFQGEPDDQGGKADFLTGKRKMGATSRSDNLLSPGLCREASGTRDQDGLGSEGAGGAGGSSSVGSAGVKKRRKTKREGSSFYHTSYFEWTDELMNHKLPERAWGPLVVSIFELGLKHSSPKVLMKLMPPKAERLTTEHIKSRLQKYRLHAHRSKEEFLEFFSLRLKAKFADFVEKEGWRQLSPRHGDEDDEDTDHDGVGDDGGGAIGGAGGGCGGNAGGETGGGAAGVLMGSESEEQLVVKVDGRLVGDIRDLGAMCVREQANLQEVLRHHIAAQLKLQAEIHDHLTATNAPGISQPSTPVAGQHHHQHQQQGQQQHEEQHRQGGNLLGVAAPQTGGDDPGGSSHGSALSGVDAQGAEGAGGSVRGLNAAAGEVKSVDTKKMTETTTSTASGASPDGSGSCADARGGVGNTGTG